MAASLATIHSDGECRLMVYAAAVGFLHSRGDIYTIPRDLAVGVLLVRIDRRVDVARTTFLLLLILVRLLLSLRRLKLWLVLR